jgi:glycosyltransferase involved in cell wall biosynthesis
MSPKGMTRPEGDGDAPSEWPAEPSADLLSRPKRVDWDRLRARGRTYRSVLTSDNVRKAINHARRGNVRLVWTAFRNLTMLQRASVSEPARPGDGIFPVVPIASGQPLVSVVIPCFNYGRFVEAAVDSVLAQTLSDVEVIVVDGGSTDGTTRELLASLQRPRTRVVLREGRHWVGANRNFGLQLARGRYACCLDADDTLDPTYLEKAVYLLEGLGYDCVSTSIRFVGERSGTVGVLEFPDLEAMTQGNHMHTCAVFRRTLWTRSEGFVDTGVGSAHVAEDWDFWIQLAAQGARLRNLVGEPLFNYRIHASGSLSSGSDVRTIAEQRLEIVRRRRRLLSPERIRLSRLQAERRLFAAEPGGALGRSMAREEGGGRCLLVALPFLLLGGAERLLSMLTACFVADGWRVIVLTTLHQDAVHGDSTDWFTRHTREVYRLPKFLAPEEWSGFLDYLLDSRRPDCLLLAGSRFVYERLDAIRRRRPGMAIVDLLFNTVGHVDSHREFRERFTSALAENAEVERWLLEIGWPAQRVRRVQSGIDTDVHRPRPADPEFRASLGIAPGDFVVGYSGRMSEEKAPDVFLAIARACAGTPGLRFVMTGAGPWAERIEREAARIGPTLTYLGKVDDVESHIATYDVLLLPSRFDGRPLVVLEALAMGVPVVASRVGGLPELIEDGRNGYLCEPADVGEFARRVLELAGDRPAAARMRLEARAFAREFLGIRRMYEGYRDAVLDAIRLEESESGGGAGTREHARSIEGVQP